MEKKRRRDHGSHVNREIEECGMRKSFSRVLGHICVISFIFNRGEENRSTQSSQRLENRNIC
jgi:hypothetical protein